MTKIAEKLTYLYNIHDHIFLTEKLFPVNIRLLVVSDSYKKLIQSCIDVIVDRLTTKYEDYPSPRGMSGANCGIPFNIISYFKKDKSIVVMINPKIVEYSTHKRIAASNCGSLRLKDSIDVERSRDIEVSWYDIDGKKYKTKHGRDTQSSTIQHEVDHNNGITILDRQVRDYNNAHPCG